MTSVRSFGMKCGNVCQRTATRPTHLVQTTVYNTLLITQIWLSRLYFASTAWWGDAATLLVNYEPAVSDAMQERWQSLNSLSADFLF